MKNAVTLFFFVVAAHLNAQVNTYFNNDPVWTVSSGCAVPYPCIRYDTYNYYLQGDTIFDSLVYKQIFRKGNITYSWLAPPPVFGCTGGGPYYGPLPEFYLRSFGKQIYIRYPSDTTEQIIYDFELDVGDTLPMIGPNWEPNNIVTSIDSFNTSNGYLKLFYINGSPSEYYIEGVGNIHGLVEPFGPVLECGYNLICYGQSDTAYWPTVGPTCNMNVGIDQWIVSYEILVYPNPVIEECKLEWTTETHDATIELVDLRGRILRSFSNVNGNYFVFGRENLQAGTYMLNIRDKSVRIVKKVVFE